MNRQTRQQMLACLYNGARARTRTYIPLDFSLNLGSLWQFYLLCQMTKTTDILMIAVNIHLRCLIRTLTLWLQGPYAEIQ